MNGTSAPDGWTSGEIEQVPTCPACNNRRRTVIHRGLKDASFGVAPGAWTMKSCDDCGTAYLDPRPNEASIGRAYERYYTHGEEGVEPGPQSIAEFARTGLGNDYRRARYGYRNAPSLFGGRWLARLLPSRKQMWDSQFRFLPKPRQGRDNLLDVGCGAGEFLRLAEASGWKGCGVEPDRNAAASMGGDFDVRTSLDDWSEEEAFDAVTLHHVIEHMHTPRNALRKLRQLMKPGAFLYIETPNIDARGHRLFGPSWRGLEVPRHLVLFSPSSLADLVSEAGFTNLEWRPRPSPRDFMDDQSRKIAAGLDPYAEGSDLRDLPAVSTPDDDELPREERQFLTLTAHAS